MTAEALLLRDCVGTRSFSTEQIIREILQTVSNASVVLLGEATHGTEEFYAFRAEVTKRLIEEKNFSTVAVEADWPDAYRLNRYVRGLGVDSTAYDAFRDFHRFPTWMWRNAPTQEFIRWLRDQNDAREAAEKVGFYGLDLYSMSASVEAVLEYLLRIDPGAEKQARERYSCFEMYLRNPQQYGFATAFGMSSDCKAEALEQLVELRRNALHYLSHDGLSAEDEHFNAEQNARAIKNGEEYYREMFSNDKNTWNIRDTHMFETIQALTEHFSRRPHGEKIVVWAHNSHVGDARATEISKSKELNLGQLAREHWGNRCCLIGFTTYSGTVTAASEWGGPAETKLVRPAVAGSYEELFHQVGNPRFVLSFKEGSPAREILREPLLERAIGVIYRPETELHSHYFKANIASQFDALIHIDSTTAVTPLNIETANPQQMPSTFPSGF